MDVQLQGLTTPGRSRLAGQNSREQNLARLDSTEIWDLIIIGGGATGLGVALDAASRGYSTVLVERGDFACGTSSRSTKLVHGGVRYLAQGNIALVTEALRERKMLLDNAPHLVSRKNFIIPVYSWFEKLFYLIGLTLYDLLAGKWGIGRTKGLGKQQVMERLPGLNPQGLYGAVSYWDGQFNDARLASALATSSADRGAVMLNYVQATQILKEAGRVAGVAVEDMETGRKFEIRSRGLVNACGVFVQDILQMDEAKAPPVLKPSQGIHLVLDASFLPGSDALMIPKTEDGRVVFLIPWRGKVLVGTTDTAVESVSAEPAAMDAEIEFLLAASSSYLLNPPQRKDVLAVFAGLRPLLSGTRRASQTGEATKELSRNHQIWTSSSGLVTVSGGKWTTYRRMAAETLDCLIQAAGLKPAVCQTENMRIRGAESLPDEEPFREYGSDRQAMLAICEENREWAGRLHPDFDFIAAQVIWAVRQEFARTPEDVLARRLGLLFLDAAAAREVCLRVSTLVAAELEKDQAWIDLQHEKFRNLASTYLL